MQSEKPKELWVYKNTGDCFSKIMAEEGVQAFFKGAGANVLRTVGSAMVLVLYSEIKRVIGWYLIFYIILSNYMFICLVLNI